jgi:hypothetical protein
LKSISTILQIVPRVPGSHDGVGDYALKLAERLKTDYGRETVFAVAAPTTVKYAADFSILGQLDSISEKQCREQSCGDIILHYVNYGYQNRGVPFRLPQILRRLRRSCGGQFVTIFHELYASTPPWQSAFWLQPLQKSLARNIARISDVCVVSSEVMGDALQRLVPETLISVHPVISTFGEPLLSTDQLAGRDPHRWVICGGRHLVERSVQSFISRMSAIPSSFSPRELFVLGGNDSGIVRAELDKLTGIACRYLPAIEVEVASGFLSSCAFGWIDYFRQLDVPAAAVLKSGSFAAYCAHGVIPVFPSAGSAIALQTDQLPGPYFVNEERDSLPSKSELPKIARETYEWYRRNVASQHLAKGIATALAISSNSTRLREISRS